MFLDVHQLSDCNMQVAHANAKWKIGMALEYLQTLEQLQLLDASASAAQDLQSRLLTLLPQALGRSAVLADLVHLQLDLLLYTDLLSFSSMRQHHAATSPAVWCVHSGEQGWYIVPGL